MKEASDGNVYYLIKMQINKDGSTEAIDWASLKLTDSDGNEYTRIDDEFLTNLGMTRMAGTKLKLWFQQRMDRFRDQGRCFRSYLILPI